LTVKGAVSAGNGKLSLTTVGCEPQPHHRGHRDPIPGKATETAQVSIAAVLNVTANNGIKLTSKHNVIRKFGRTTTSGPNKGRYSKCR
jgi:hypothetical protein